MFRSLHVLAVATVATLTLTSTGVALASNTQGSDDGQNTSELESMRVRDSEYAIPEGARFVARTGSDRNAGTADAPLRTIRRAVAGAPRGGTVVVRGGTYRESLGHITKQVTIQAYPHEQVWLKGSVVVQGFARSGSVWVKPRWKSALCHTCFPKAAIDREHPAAGLPDQVFFDGAPLRQVTKATAVEPGTFYVDVKRQRLVVGSNPSGRFVESTYHPIAMQFDGAASGSKLLGIGVAQYGPNFTYKRNPAMVIANATNLTFENDAFHWSATRGLSVFRAGGVVKNSDFLNNGANGLHAHRADGLVVMGNLLRGSNIELFSTAPTATASLAAIKVTSTMNVVVKDNDVSDNDATGVWFDLSAYNITISNNVISRNAGFGVFYEVSAKGLIAGNLITDNDRDGVRIAGSNSTKVWCNMLTGNGWAQLGVYEDGRTQRNPKLRALGITWDTSGITAHNNVYAAGPRSTGPIFNSFDASRPKRLTTMQMLQDDGNNVFVQASPSLAGVASWQTSLKQTTRWHTLEELQTATGHEDGSTTVDEMPPAPPDVPVPGDVAAAMS